MKRYRNQFDEASKSPKPNAIDIAESSQQPQMTGEASARKLTPDDALEYVMYVKEKLQGTSEKYYAFTEAVRDFKSQRIDIQFFKAKVEELFADNPELLSGFNNFLPPEGSKIIPLQEDGPGDVKKLVEFEDAMQFVEKFKGLKDDNHLFRGFLEILNLYRMENLSVTEVHQKVANLLHDRQDLLTEFTIFLPHHVNSLTDHNTQKETKTSHAERSKSADQPDLNSEKEKEKCKSCEQMEHHRTTHNRIVCTLENTVAKIFPQDIHDQSFCLREKVKERLSSYHYREFLKCINHFHMEKITRPEVQSLMNDLLGAYPDIVNDVNQLIDCIEKTDYNKDGRDKDRALKDKGKVKMASERSQPSCKGKNKAKRVDLSKCESCTPSYWLLAKNYPILEASQRTETDKEVLNDHWVAVPSGSKNPVFKFAVKNDHEELLLQCEDHRYEMDMFLESIKITIKRAEELKEQLNNKSIDPDSIFPVEDHFTCQNLRSIKLIYGKHGLHIVRELKKNVRVCLPIILTRLKQKLEHGTMMQSDFSKLWAQVLGENHQKLLDHRNFCLQQQDSEFLSEEDLLAEISKASQQKSKHKNLGKYIPHMEFSYFDSKIHEDFYGLVKISCEEICSSQQLDKVLKIWNSFVEPMVAAKSGKNDVEKDGSSNSSGPEETSINFIEDELSPIVDLEKDGLADINMEPLVQPKEATSQEKESQVFYGDNTFYVFFRLHQEIYSRLLEAKRLANDTTPADSYARFLDLLFNYLLGAYHDKYEEECRTIFSNWSSLIFSIERLINKFSRQLLAISKNEIDNKLLHLHEYEKLREPGRFMDEVYTANARMLLQRKIIFRFECFFVPETDGETQFTIQQLVFRSIKFKAPDVTTYENFTAYLKSRVVPIPKKKRPGDFVKRIMKQYSFENKDEEMTKAMKGVRIANGLQCKMNCTTSKTRYVKHSQDSMMRTRQRKRRPSNEICKRWNGDSLRVQNFHKMMLSRIDGVEHYKPVAQVFLV